MSEPTVSERLRAQAEHMDRAGVYPPHIKTQREAADTIDALVGAATPILDVLEASFPAFAAFGEFRALRAALEKAKG